MAKQLMMEREHYIENGQKDEWIRSHYGNAERIDTNSDKWEKLSYEFDDLFEPYSHSRKETYSIFDGEIPTIDFIEPKYDKSIFPGMRDSGVVYSTKDYTIAHYEAKELRLIKVAEKIKDAINEHFVLYDYKGNIRTDNRKAIQILNSFDGGNISIDDDLLIVDDTILEIQKESNYPIKSEVAAEKIIVKKLYEQNYPKDSILVETTLYNTRSRPDITIIKENAILAVIEIRIRNRSSFDNELNIKFSHQLDSYYQTIIENQSIKPKVFIVFYDDNIDIFNEYNTKTKRINKIEKFPPYEELLKIEDEGDISGLNSSIWDEFVKTIDILKLNKIKKGVNDENEKEGIKVRDFLKKLAQSLQIDIPQLSEYSYKLNSATTQPQWNYSNGFRLSFIKNNNISLTKVNQINLTFWSSWGGAVFIKDNEMLFFNNKERRNAISDKYPVEFTENNLHITALSFKSSFPTYEEVLKAFNILINIDKESNIYDSLNQNINKYPTQQNICPATHNDVPDKDDTDSLSIQKDVNAFAKLIAFKGTPTPLSIGIFGKWGSGKSFFMKKLSKQIDYFSKHTDKDIFYRDIIHVEFNAWHYSDTNLWASLVYKIFSDINEQKFNDKTNKNQLENEEVSGLYEKLKSSQKKIQEKENEKDKINEKITTLKEEEKKQIENYQESKNKIDLLKSPDYIKLVLDDSMIKEKIEGLKEKLEIDKELNYHTIQNTYYELKDITTKIRKAVLLLCNDKKFRKVFLYLIIPLTILLFLGLKYLPDIWNLTSIGVYLIPAVLAIQNKINTTIKPMVNNMNIILDKWDTIRAKKEIEENEKFRLEKEKQDEEYKKLKKIEEEISNLNDLKQNIENEIEDIKNGKFFKKFISDKVTSSNYKKHLGLISLIRDDFLELQDFLLGNKNQGKNKIDRIVLYIDDLDRCNDNLVVDVLEAIHLLLAFKLFVVVVGVDPRWIEKSLENKFLNLSNTKITSKEYLEKIFQIPFKIKDLNKEDKQTLIQNILKDNIVEIKNEEIRKNGENNEKIVYTNINYSPMTDEETNKLLEIIDNAEVKDSIYNIHQELKLLPEEAEYIEQLSNLFGNTPRTIKRYINIYRIIRSHEDILELINDKTSDYKIILLLLTEVILKEETGKSIKKVVNENTIDINLDKDLKYMEEFDENKRSIIEKFIKRFSFV
ncbi:P-loop NTPase fold protein [Aliarcobacter butzleri]|uniref:P-loop NTPase fold protein n=1 Tax=Aliarcobacter butzleri TaxID=28197 RepID=UPI003AFB076F